MVALLEFIGAQFGVFGPILFVVLARALRDPRVPLYAWQREAAPRNNFAEVTKFAAARVRIVKDEARLAYTCRLSGFKDTENRR